MSGAPTLRRLLGVLLAVLGVLVAGLIVVTTLQRQGSQDEADAESRRARSFLLADSMRQSSNDLTNMVRLHVATGEPRYRRYYEEILAIREGTAPRPLDYDSSFWDRVLARGKAGERYGPPRSLVQQMREAEFTEAEFRALNDSLTASNGLARLEVEVMDRVGAGRAGDRDLRRLLDRGYLAEKGRIMAAIRRFTGLVDDRTRREVQDLRDLVDTLSLIQFAILGLIVLVGIGALRVLSRVAVRPLARLADATRRIAGGDYAERADVHGVRELEQVATAFNEMGNAVQSDVAARERAEQEAVAARLAAEEASGAKSTFLAAMSHEIRTPMNGVTGMLEVLARTDLTPSQRHMVATAESSAQSLLQIIGDVLDFSKIEASKLELAPRTLDLRAVLHAAVETFRHTASAKGLLLTSSIDERLAAAHVGDPLRLRQVLTNFLSNAVKFTSVGGIEIEARVLDESDEAQTVCLAVTDTGVGVTPEQQRELFAEFAQADAETAQHFGGTGLGLVICRRLGTLMGGEVTMQSAARGGTTMRLTVPLPVGDPAAIDPREHAVADRGAATRPKPTREEALREGSLLLIAEDHAVNRSVLRHQLDLIGFEADFAPTGEDALELFASGDYGLVLTDLNMPGMDGYELARSIRRHEAGTGSGRTPVIALTANVMQGEPERCREAGMDDFAAKPTTIPFLAGKLRQWLAHVEWPQEPEPELPAAVASLAAEGVLDLAALAEVTGGDPELTSALVADFVASTREDLDALEAALAEGGVEEARRQAHRIKGAALIVGAKAIADVAQQVENAAGRGAPREELVRFAGRLHETVVDCEAAAAALR